MKKIIAGILVLSFCFLLFSCDKTEKPADETTTGEYVLPTPVIDSDISFPYTSADKLNPYSSKSSINRALLPVIYESLYYQSEDGRGVLQLAESGKTDGKASTVKLKSGILFSDGTELTAGIVKDSFEKAKASEYYKATLSEISDVTVIDNLTLRFSYNCVTPFQLNALNFPIVYESGDTYIGTGKYKLEYLDGAAYLAVNKNHVNYRDKWNKQIALFDMAGVSGFVYPFKANGISVATDDLSDGKYVNLSSKTVSVPTTNLIYAGLNTTWAGSVTSLTWVRRAVNVGINRKLIASSSYLGQSTAVVTPFKPEMYQLPNELDIDVSGDTQKAVAILEKNGYTTVNSDKTRSNGSGGLSLSILVCSDNKYKVDAAKALKSSLESLGFSVSLNEKKKAEDFIAALKEGHYSIYIGEIKLGDNYDLTEFFSTSGSVNYGIDSKLFKMYTRFKNGTDTITPFIENFNKNVPFLPLFYRKAVVSINPNIEGASNEASDIYASAVDWHKK